MASLRGLIQRRPVVFIPLVGVGSFIDEEPDELAMTKIRGQMQRRPVVFIPCVYIGPVIHQRTH